MKIEKYANIFAIVIFLTLFFVINRPYAFLFLIAYLMVYFYPRLMVVLGNLNYSKDRLNKSEGYFKRVYTCFYAPIKHKLSYSYILILQGRLDEAEEVLEVLSNRKIESKELINLKLNQSLICWKKGKLEDAIQILSDTYRDYKTMIIYQNLGYFLILKGDYQKALEFNLEAYEYDKTNVGILDNLAENYYFMAQYDKALELFENIYKESPSFASPYFYYALTLIQIGKKSEAMDILNKGLECKFSYLSAVQKEEIEAKIKELEE